jgi:Mor family transcriptional regulator
MNDMSIIHALIESMQSNSNPLSKGADVSTGSRHAWPVLLEEMADVVERVLAHHRIDTNRRHLALEIMLSMGDHFGGRQFYIPRGESIRRERRDHQIFLRLGPEKASSLAAEFRLSEATVYRIAKQQHAAQRKKNPLRKTA